ncbi:hypothetical protein AB0D49_20755 [Streptomyces sp. NPDC048290]|uniref:hypothetical protein n=1 Tax=Streptomyces sp. NPDC048290 TaxID=3155811 RepID=UPI00341A407E
MTVHTYARRCEELFVLGGYAAARATAREGLDKEGPDPVLQPWLGLAHAAEEDDDHDDEAEAAYEEGLRQWPDDLGLLVSYLELCQRADEWEHPARGRRAEPLKRRIAELAPPGSPEAQQVAAAVGWAGRGYWEDAEARRARARHERAELSTDIKDPVPYAEPGAAHPEDLRAATVAAVLETLDGPRNALLRLVLHHRVACYGVTIVLALLTNQILIRTGTVSFSLWGWFWYLPLLLTELKLKQARRLARERVVEAVRARHAAEPDDA